MAGRSNADLKERVAKLEALVGESRDESVLPMFSLMEQMAEELRSLRTQLEVQRTETGHRLSEVTKDFMEIVGAWKESKDGIMEEITLLKRAVARGQPVGGEASTKLKVPEPKPFGGARNAKELENFLWDMEQYFKAAHVVEAEKVTITSMYLSGDAKLWWRTRLDDDESAGRPKIESWDALKKELKDQFLPTNTAWIARETLRNLKQTGSIREYVKQFSSLMLDIRNMSEEDKLFNFMSGLQNWAQNELRRQGVRDLPTAMAAADCLVDYRPFPFAVQSVHPAPLRCLACARSCPFANSACSRRPVVESGRARPGW